jgi:hypothetical protein
MCLAVRNRDKQVCVRHLDVTDITLAHDGAAKRTPPRQPGFNRSAQP